MKLRSVNNNPTPLSLILQAFRFFLMNWRQFFYLVALPLFVILLSRIVFFLASGAYVKGFLSFSLMITERLLFVVFSVQWIRLVLLRVQETQIFIPTFDRRYVVYGVLALGVVFITSITQSIFMSVLGPILGAFGSKGAGILMVLVIFQVFYTFLFARLSFAFVAAATDKPYHVTTTWEKSKTYWKALFGYIMLLEVVFGLLAALVYLVYFKFNPQQGLDPKELMKLILENSWITQIFAYVSLALRLYGVCVYTKRVC